jgi:tRNA threonylcarbamoyl adenosine modification protein YeaZ
MLLNTSSSNILAISASTSLCSVVLETPYNRYEWQTTDSNQHSEQLLPAIQHLLNQAGLTALKSNDFIAVDVGPGSFTSVRVACSIAQGLALGWNCRVIAVESLTAMVYQQILDNTIPTPTYVMAVIDARMNEYYAAQYYYDIHNCLEQIVVPMLIPYNFEHLEMYQQSNILIGNTINIDNTINITSITDTVNAINSINKNLSNKNNNINTNNTVLDNAIHNKIIIQGNPSAIGTLVAAKIYIQQGLFSTHLDQLQPLYVRNQVALTTLERAVIK